MTTLISPTCQRCGLAATRNVVVQPDAPPTLRVLFLGRDPGGKEDVGPLAGHPFIGPAGQLLRRMVRDIGIPPAWVGYDNVVHCHTPKDRGPTAIEVVSCGVWVDVVLARLQPEIVVPLGQEALEAVMNRESYNPKHPKWKLAAVSGQELRLSRGRIVVVPAYHPSAGLRNGNSRRELAKALRKVKELLGVEDNEPMSLPYVEMVDRLPPGVGEVAMDVEWGRDGKVLVVGSAWREGERICVRAIAPSEGADIECAILHNAPGDVTKLASVGIRPAAVHDTMLMAYGVRDDQRYGSLGLKELALAKLGLSWGTMEELGLPEDMAVEVRDRYCLNDTIATLLLKEEYLGKA